MAHAVSKGQMSKGKTFLMIVINAGTNDMPVCGCAIGTRSGITTATTRLMSMVYVVRLAALPPSFIVTTAPAVAVGQMRHIILLSIIIRHVVVGYRCNINASNAKSED